MQIKCNQINNKQGQWISSSTAEKLTPQEEGLKDEPQNILQLNEEKVFCKLQQH